MRAALEVPNRPDGTFLALNLSPRALLSAPVQSTLPQDLRGIVIELTEHEVFGAVGELENALAELRRRGALIALDDAGAGYAGLQQMIRIAPDILKLDRTLVHGAHADGSRQALLEALIGFASSTGAAICAEGVEDLDDLRTLVALDVSYAQGYGLCRPGPGWPQPDPAAAAASASNIRAGMRLSNSPRGAGAFARGLARLSDELSSARTVHDLGAADVRAAALLGADELALLLVLGNEIELISRNRPALGERWSLGDFPSKRYVLEHRVPGQVVVGDEAELAELAKLGLGTVLFVPVICNDEPLAERRAVARDQLDLVAEDQQERELVGPEQRRGAHVGCPEIVPGCGRGQLVGELGEPTGEGAGASGRVRDAHAGPAVRPLAVAAAGSGCGHAGPGRQRPYPCA